MQEHLADFVVAGRASHHEHGIELLGSAHFVDVGINLRNAVLGGSRSGFLLVGIANGDEFQTRGLERRIDAHSRVAAATHKANTQRFGI
jgi:hypothetical protein